MKSKPRKKPMLVIPVRLRNDQIKFLNQYVNVSEVIRVAIDEYITKSEEKNHDN